MKRSGQFLLFLVLLLFRLDFVACQVNSTNYLESIHVQGGLRASVAVAESCFASGDSIPVAITLANTGTGRLLLEDEDVGDNHGHVLVDTARKEINIRWMYNDLMPEYGLPPLEILEGGATRTTLIKVRAPEVPVEGARYAIELGLTFLTFDPMLAPVVGKSARTHFVADSLSARVTALQEWAEPAPLSVRIMPARRAGR